MANGVNQPDQPGKASLKGITIEATQITPGKDVAPAAPSVPNVDPLASTTAKPVAEAPKVEVKQTEGKNVFTELFGNDKVEKNATMMDSVTGKQDSSKKSFFGEKPKLADIKKVGKKSFKVSKATPGKLVFQVAVLLLVVTGGFFYTQNSKSFDLLGVNVAQKAMLAQEQVDELNAEIAVQNHLSTVLLLDQFGSLADEYFYNLGQAESDYNSSNKKAEYTAAADAGRPFLLIVLKDIVEQLGDEISADEIVAAKAVVEELSAALSAKSGSVDESVLLQDIQDLKTASKLLGSLNFKSNLRALDLENISDEELADVYASYNDLSESIASLISGIQKVRIDYTLYLEEFEDLTKQVDPLFNTEFVGNLEIDDVSFDGTVVSLGGSSVTDDTKNFTLISNLLDTYEASAHFKNVEERSFLKSDGGESQYTGNFRVSMEIENPE